MKMVRELRNQYNQECAEVILDRLAGGEFLSDILLDDMMPSYVNFLRWLKEEPWLAEAYDTAKTQQGHFIAQLAYKRAVQSDGENVAMDKLAFEAGKWMSGKVLPKVYGDKVQTETNISGTLDVRKLDNSQLDEAIRLELAGLIGGSGERAVIEGN